MLSAENDHFGLFGLPRRYEIDLVALEKAWLAVSAQVHPDRYATATPAARRVAMQWAARANEAYRVLRNPLARARYLCEVQGVDLQVETNTAMSPAFLMQQLEWREQLDEARQRKDAALLDDLSQALGQARAAAQVRLAVLLDQDNDVAGAAKVVREWMFLEKLEQEVESVRHDGA
ncbi:Fe-S protein assembly co-chaperone HscB [Kerstersia similis]|uniref:Fe-S protein assembly co-chaperone HscB n=1 Tax=Kerstersia similis TaxID=206505 RepID=UPI0039EF470A